MSIFKNSLYWIVGSAILLCLVCAAVQAAQSDYENLTIKEILNKSTAYSGKGVSIEGNITSECPMRGCKVTINDTTGDLLVDLAPNNFTIPLNLVGHKAKVYGNVTIADNSTKLSVEPGNPYIIGKRVEISGEFQSPLVSTG
jgi:hypothetical protein